jgi:hypothetical protein
LSKVQQPYAKGKEGKKERKSISYGYSTKEKGIAEDGT